MTIQAAAPAPSRALTSSSLPSSAFIGDLSLESGDLLPDVTIGYETWGQLNPAGDNAILVLHALTGDTHVSSGQDPHLSKKKPGATGSSPGWWEGIVGPGCVIDTNRFFVLSPNILGGCYGSTGPSSPAPASVDPHRKPWGSRFPLLTLRDSVFAEQRLAEHLGIESFFAVVGGSLGGARAMEWALTFPSLVKRCIVIASGPSATADHIAWAQTQNLAIRMDPDFAGGDYYQGKPPESGLGLARRIAHTTYRSAPELHFRFGRDWHRGENPLAKDPSGQAGRFSVESYLDHHAKKLSARFDANSYLAINHALMSHDITQGRGSLNTALALSTCQWAIAYVDSDRLFHPSESIVMASSLPHPIEADVIRSPSGHDGFLIEREQVEKILHSALTS